MKLLQGDCLELMQDIPEGSVDMVLCDLPYGMTDAKWDKEIPIKPLFEQYRRILKKNGTAVLFGSEPFSSKLRIEALDLFKYDWIWDKVKGTGHLNAKNKPLKSHEIISVFSKGTTIHASKSKNRMCYNPQMGTGKPYTKITKHITTGELVKATQSNINFVGNVHVNNGSRYPKSVLRLYIHNVGKLHPTEKPVEILEYLIKTYTNPGETVLDNCMGSGSTGVACINTSRKFIGIELDEVYYNIAYNRIGEVHDNSEQASPFSRKE